MAKRPSPAFTPDEYAALAEWLTEPRLTRYIPVTPTIKQRSLLVLTDLEAFYGGAAGGGKSAGLLMAALQYVDVPGYAALLFRRTFQDLALPGALMSLSHEWLRGTDAHWRQATFTWEFPSGATLTFGYLGTESDKYRYQSAAFQFVGFDELTHFSETQYRYLFSRVRRPKASGRYPPSQDGLTLDRVPLRIRSASNPGGMGHDWVNGRFVDPATRVDGATMIKARLADNPYLDAESYVRSLSHLNEGERQRLLNGDWDAWEPGAIFDRSKFRVITKRPKMGRLVRAWDIAGTRPTPLNPDPDWTVGTLYGQREDGDGYVVLDVVRFRETPGKTRMRFAQTARLDGPSVHIWIEQEPGASGKNLIRDYQKAAPGYIVKGYRPSADKITRAKPFAAAADNDLVEVVRGDWTAAWLYEHERFPGGSHDDQVDSSALAHYAITDRNAGRAKAGVAKGTLHRPASESPAPRQRGVARVPVGRARGRG